MGKQRKPKTQRKAQRAAVAAPPLSWQDNEGIHCIVPGVPQPGDEEKMTAEFQKQIRESPLWAQMVAEFGEERATELLKECKAQIKK